MTRGGDFHLAEPDGQRAAFLAGDASGAAVGNVALGVERAEIAADSHVHRSQLEADAGGLQGAAADQVLDRVIAEEGQVSGTAAGGDTRCDRIHAALDPVFCQIVQMRGFGGFQFRRPARLDRQPAQPIGHQHNDFRFVLGLQLANELLNIHDWASFIFLFRRVEWFTVTKQAAR